MWPVCVLLYMLSAHNHFFVFFRYCLVDDDCDLVMIQCDKIYTTICHQFWNQHLSRPVKLTQHNSSLCTRILHYCSRYARAFVYKPQSNKFCILTFRFIYASVRVPKNNVFCIRCAKHTLIAPSIHQIHSSAFIQC